jgi:alkanesulfonate monooxygenase SsuD/methylene tetrahydromethanopterin reductase-like flavin-dependent oxidoreductase (luciferase family)
LHAAISARPAAGLAGMTAATMQGMYGLPADRARQLAIAGTPSQVAAHLALYSEAGAQLIAVTCDPAPSAESWELLAETQRLLNQR